MREVFDRYLMDRVRTTMRHSVDPVIVAAAAGILLFLSLTTLQGPPMDPFFTGNTLVPLYETRKDGHLIVEAYSANITPTASLVVLPPSMAHEGGNGHAKEPVHTPEVRKTTCNTSHPKIDLCEMEGDVRIHGKTGTIHSLSSSSANTTNQWRVKPYPRKDDPVGMAKVRELTIMELQTSPLRCQVNHTVPAVVFSTGTFVYNFFHAMGDVLIPLFVTSHSYSGQVQFLVTDMKSYFISGYKPIIDSLTRYDLIDLDNDDRVHCFPRATIGLKHEDTLDLPIDPSTGLSLRNFTSMLRSTFSLKRSHAVNAAVQRPLLLVITRKWSRRFVNVGEIVRLAESLGFEVVVSDGFGGGRFANVVNMCDVMLGVHGAGLTNMVFLPEGAVVVQVVPLGRMLQWTRECYRRPAVQMGLHYVDYEIEAEESTLADLYPINHTVIADPTEIGRRGKFVYRDLYMVKQNVRINVTRFRGVLSGVLDVLRK